MGKTRKAMYAGSWYPGTKKEVTSALTAFFKNAKKTKKIDGEISVILVPHAGWIYSGQVAAYAFQYLIGKQYDSVFVIGGSHHVYFRGAALPSFDKFETPLGDVSIDTKAVNFLTEFTDVYKINDEPQIPEHSLEIELPFLQYALKSGWKLVPIVFGENDYHGMVSAAKAITEYSKKKHILVVISSDMSHYHPYDDAVRMDKKAIELVTANDIYGLITALQERQVEYCGQMALIPAMLYASQTGATDINDIYYANSGDVTGDKGKVVGYTAIVFSKGKDSGGTKPDEAFLSEDGKKELLKLARTTIEKRLAGEKYSYKPKNKELTNTGAAFVTLEKHGNLRGCIGHIMAVEPLYKCVMDMAVAAATSDPRFNAVSETEMKDVDIEISVLTPLERVNDINEIKVGRDGLYIKKGYYSGLLLPQVATDYGWNREQFLAQVCNKAGLPADAWQSKDAELYKFQAIIFSESEF